MKRVVLDTNIYISGLVFGGKPQEVLIWAEVGLFKLFVSTEILFELQKRLDTKFGWTGSRVTQAINKVLAIATLAMPEINITACIDPDDNKILECAVEADVDYIVSGDKHLLNMGVYQGIEIVPPADFLRRELWKQ